MKNSKIPLLPLYIADAVVIVLVLAIALPSAFRGESISTAQTIFCCLAVLLSMFALLVPYFLEYKKDIATKFEHSDEAQKNFEIIFDDLSALRDALADLVVRVENDEENFSGITQFEKNLINLKDSAKNKFVEYNESIASLSDSVSKLESAVKNAKNSLEEIGADLVVIKEIEQANNESVSEQIQNLQNEIANLQNSKVDDANVDVDYEIEEEKPAPRAKVEVGHLLKRALQNADDTKQSVEKFISRNTPAQQQDETIVEESTDEVSEEKSDESQELENSEQPLENIVEYDVVEEDKDISEDEIVNDVDDEADFFESADSPKDDVESADDEHINASSLLVAEPPDTNALLKRFDSEFEIKQAEKKLSKQEHKKEKKSDDEKVETEMLFDDLPISRGKIKPKKGDTVITVNALIGIGNTPYLRGDGAGLSQDKGIAMHYVEIGKWQYVITDLDETLNFSVLKNDITSPQGESNFTINAGERKELNLFFPMEQELF